MKCRDNRKARIKRNKKLLLRLAHKRFDHLAYKGESINPAYYDVVITHIRTKTVSHRRFFNLRKMKIVAVPNAEYREMLATLATLTKMLKGATFTVPAKEES